MSEPTEFDGAAVARAPLKVEQLRGAHHLTVAYIPRAHAEDAGAEAHQQSEADALINRLYESIFAIMRERATVQSTVEAERVNFQDTLEAEHTRFSKLLVEIAEMTDMMRNVLQTAPTLSTHRAREHTQMDSRGSEKHGLVKVFHRKRRGTPTQDVGQVSTSAASEANGDVQRTLLAHFAGQLDELLAQHGVRGVEAEISQEADLTRFEIAGHRPVEGVSDFTVLACIRPAYLTTDGSVLRRGAVIVAGPQIPDSTSVDTNSDTTSDDVHTMEARS